MKIDASEMKIVEDLFKMIRRIYQHEHCNKQLRSYIEFEMGKEFTQIDFKKFLREKDT